MLLKDDSGREENHAEFSLDKGRALFILALILLFEEQIKLWRRTEKQRPVRRKRKLSLSEDTF